MTLLLDTTTRDAVKWKPFSLYLRTGEPFLGLLTNLEKNVWGPGTWEASPFQWHDITSRVTPEVMSLSWRSTLKFTLILPWSFQRILQSQSHRCYNMLVKLLCLWNDSNFHCWEVSYYSGTLSSAGPVPLIIAYLWKWAAEAFIYYLFKIFIWCLFT